MSVLSSDIVYSCRSCEWRPPLCLGSVLVRVSQASRRFGISDDSGFFDDSGFPTIGDSPASPTPASLRTPASRTPASQTPASQTPASPHPGPPHPRIPDPSIPDSRIPDPRIPDPRIPHPGSLDSRHLVSGNPRDSLLSLGGRSLLDNKY